MFSIKSLMVLVVFSSLLHFLMSCGTEAGNPVIKRPTTPRVVAQDSVEADLFDLTDGLFDSDDEDESSALIMRQMPAFFGLNLVGSSCSSDGFQANATFSAERALENPAQSILYRVSIERAFSVEWKSPQGGLWCDSKNRIRKRRALLEGASVLRTGRFLRTLEGIGELSETDYINAQFASDGFKKTVFDKVERIAGDLNVSSSVTWKKSRSSLIETQQGETSDVSESVVAEDAPLRILKIFKIENGSLIRLFEVLSGKSEISRADGSVVSLEYKNLKFGSTGSCYATSGILTGTVSLGTAADAERVTFQIDFSKSSGGRPSIEFSDGQTALLSGVCGEKAD